MGAADSECWRLLEALDVPALARVAAARARAREVAWAQRAETHRRGIWSLSSRRAKVGGCSLHVGGSEMSISPLTCVPPAGLEPAT